MEKEGKKIQVRVAVGERPGVASGAIYAIGRRFEAGQQVDLEVTAEELDALMERKRMGMAVMVMADRAQEPMRRAYLDAPGGSEASGGEHPTPDTDADLERLTAPPPPPPHDEPKTDHKVEERKPGTTGYGKGQKVR